MKRIFALLLVLALLLAGCSKQEPAPEAAPATEPTAAPTTEATEPTTEATEPPTEEPTEAIIYRNPLTGEVLEVPFEGQITAVVFNNHKKCLPQHGQTDADIFYEVEVEGSITRCLGLFTDLEDAEKIGPVRSVRTYFNILSRAVQAPIIHCGGSTYARDGYVDYAKTQLPNWQHVDANASSGFYRDQARKAQGYAHEHTLFTDGERLLEVLKNKGFDTPAKTPDALLQFTEEPQLNGETATSLTLKFKGSKLTTFAYDQETGLYNASQYGDEWVDGNTGEAISFRNVIALYADQAQSVAGSARQFYDLIGSGDGHFVCDGQIIPIKWHHASYEEPFQYTLEDGSPLYLGVGRTYIAILGGNPISYE